MTFVRKICAFNVDEIDTMRDVTQFYIIFDPPAFITFLSIRYFAQKVLFPKSY